MSSVFTRRALAFLVALALAVVAAVAVFSYIRDVEEQAASQVDAVVGYVATDRIDPGTLADSAIQNDQIEEREIPRDLLAPNAVTDLAQVGGRVVEEVILPGDQLVIDRFAAPGQGVQILTIPAEHQAMSVEVGVPPGVAGFIKEGDHISLIGYIDVPVEGSLVTVTDEETGAQVQVAQLEPRAQYLVQDLEVLAVGRRIVPSEEDPAGTQEISDSRILLTLAVSPQEAEKLTFATLGGELWATLLPEDELDPVQTPGRSNVDVFED